MCKCGGARCAICVFVQPNVCRGSCLPLCCAGVMLEKAGATAVVPEVLEPSLQLAAAVLSQVGAL